LFFFMGRGEASHGNKCRDLPHHAKLSDALMVAVSETRGGFDLDMWVTVVNRDGVVCAVTFSGNNRGDQWPGSRVISAQKANTSNAFSIPGLALSTANLFSAVQPGGSLFGLQLSNPINTKVAYAGSAGRYGSRNDPMVGKKIGGINVFGGGLALYSSDGRLLGGLGASGDSSCADHNVTWRIRDWLGLDNIPGGVSGTGDDNIVYDVTVDAATGHTTSAGGWGHPTCVGGETVIGEALPTTHPIGP